MLQVSLFNGPDYLIEAEGTVSAHAFLATNGVIPEGGLVVSVDAPNLSEFDLAGVSVEGGEIVAVRDDGFDLRMTEYTTLVNLPIADDGETEVGETATFSLAEGEGYEIISNYSGGTFNLVDTREDIPLGVVTEPNDIIGVAVDTQITPENPSFSVANSIYFDIGNRYLNTDGTYTYLDYNQDVDLYQLELSAGDTIAAEVFEVEGNIWPDFANYGFVSGLAAFDTEGNRLIANASSATPAAPDKLFGTANNVQGAYNEDGTVNFDETENYLEFTAPEDGIYYIGVSGQASATPDYGGLDTTYNIEEPASGTENKIIFGNYEVEIDLLTPDNPRKTGTPTPPVSNPNVTNPPTLSLGASPITEDSEGNITFGVVEFVEDGGTSEVNFTIRAEGEIPEGGIEFVLNSSANLFDYVSFSQQDKLPSTIGGQYLSAFYNEDGIPTGILLRMEQPTMTVNLEAANRATFAVDFFGIEPYYDDVYEPLETDGAEDVTFFLQPGEGYEIDGNAGTTEVTYYDSVEDIPASGGSGGIVPEVGVTISETQLIETEETETTVTFTLSEPPPAEGLTVLLDSDDNTTVGSVLSQFDVLNADVVGGDFPIANADRSGFFFNITEQTASITLAVFNELAVDSPGIPEDSFQEGILDLTFALEPQINYTIDPEASEVNLTIADNPDSQIFARPSASSDALIESEGSVGTLTLSLGAPPPAAGLTVSLSTDALADFDTAAITVEGGSVAAVRDDGLDITLTAREATVSLPILDDGIDEVGEAATFTVEPGDDYETAEAVAAVTFFLSDTPGQASAPVEIEGNSTLPVANSLGLSAANPTVSIRGGLSRLERASGGGDWLGFSEDVDFYSFTLAEGQTVALDIDGRDDFGTFITYPDVYIFPEFQDIPQTVDTELRVFDAEGNELAANNDGAAPGEDFSRDPFIEFTAETAGTYYVGVSALGNRNYDPFTQFSGSGWTFPEVGVFYGDYDLTASLIDSTIEFDIVGTEAAETLVGDAEDNNIDGLGGEDTIAGGLANDLILGGDGDDVLRGDRNSRSTQDGEPGGDDIIFGGEGNDRIGGKAGNDILSGDAGDDFIWGDDGDDILMGVTGNDILTGDNSSSGSGSDTFVFGNGDGTDTITDFEVGLDFIGLVEGELVFEDLSFTQDGDNTLLGVSDSGETLAILNNVQASLLDASSFVIVPDVSNPQEALALI
ncbi:MAG: pre-peptidase C-terminal domain-containing protein [Cyanobacteria bacterium J06639_14]